ncbi:DNA recombination protein RmuC [Roseivivax sp. CAU 1761]
MQFIEQYQSVILLAILAALVIAGLARMLGGRRAAGPDPAMQRENTELQTRLATLERQHGALEDARAGLQDRLGAAQAEIASLTVERDGARQSLAEERARLEAAVARLEAGAAEREDRHAAALEELRRDREAALEAQRRAAEAARGEAAAERAALADQLRQLDATRSRLEAELAAQKESHERLRAETERNRDQFVQHFRNISSELLDSQRKQTTEFQRGELEKVIEPFKVELTGLKSNLKELHDRSESQRKELGGQIALMQQQASKLSDDAHALAVALRGEKKRQGDWGETILDRILEVAGLVEGTHFTRQGSVTNAEGRRLVPDIVVHLPQDRDVVIDSKVSLNAYSDLVNAQDKEAEAAALKRHAAAVRAHCRALGGKSYDDLGYQTVDSVLMFMPVDGALTAALSQDSDLMIQAAEQGVHLVTPATLMPILKIVDHLWTIEQRNRNVEDIVERAGRLHDKFVLAVESVQAIGQHLDKAVGAHGEALNRLSQGSGNVLRQVDQLRRLGAKTRKTLPSELLEMADEPDPEEQAPDAAGDRDRSVPAE